MFKDKFEELATFIEEIDVLSAIDFLVKAKQTVPSIIDNDFGNREDLQFEETLSELIKNARNKQTDEDILIYYLYKNLRILLRKKMIYAYAEQLEIEQGLFKNEMNKLFKGKFD